MFCSNCGSQMLEGAKFCQKCGTKLNADTNVEIQSRLTEEPVNTKDKTQENSDQSNITGENVGYNTSNSNEKVIPKKLIFGIVIVVVIICGVFALLASDHKDKYIEIVKMGILEFQRAPLRQRSAPRGFRPSNPRILRRPPLPANLFCPEAGRKFCSCTYVSARACRCR